MGRTLLIISGGIEAIPGIRLAKEMGLHVVVSDMNPDAPGFGLADDRIIASTYDIAATVAAAQPATNDPLDPQPNGSVLGQIITPLRRVGIYVPGGKASYPSSVLMNAIPATVAGVQQIGAMNFGGEFGKHKYVLRELVG